MPAPIPDLSRDQQCHHYMAPAGQRCGSPALKGQYYCYYHQIKKDTRQQRRILIDPEITRLELPAIEDRASIFVALAAVIHRLGENTIDTTRAGQMIYGLQTALQALPPEPAQPAKPAAPPRARHREPAAPREADAASRETPPAADAGTVPPPEPATIPITREGLLYFLRSRHCAHCNRELFPPHELTERAHPGASPDIIEEARPTLPATGPSILPGLQAVGRKARRRHQTAQHHPGQLPSPCTTIASSLPGYSSPHGTRKPHVRRIS